MSVTQLLGDARYHPITARPGGLRSAREHEVERGGLAAVLVPVAGQQQLLVEDAVAGVARLAGKVELSGQDRSAGKLRLDVDVTGTPGVEPRNDGGEPVRAV